MRNASFSLLALFFTMTACGGRELDHAASTSPYPELQRMAAQELACPVRDVTVEEVGESRIVARGCERVTAYVYACRKPGPHEREYIANTPAPPSDEAIEAVAQSEKSSAEHDAMAMRREQLAYSQGLIAIRLEDMHSGYVQETALRHELNDLPAHYLDRECRYMHAE